MRPAGQSGKSNVRCAKSHESLSAQAWGRQWMLPFGYMAETNAEKEEKLTVAELTKKIDAIDVMLVAQEHRFVQSLVNAVTAWREDWSREKRRAAFTAFWWRFVLGGGSRGAIGVGMVLAVMSYCEVRKQNDLIEDDMRQTHIENLYAAQRDMREDWKHWYKSVYPLDIERADYNNRIYSATERLTIQEYWSIVQYNEWRVTKRFAEGEYEGLRPRYRVFAVQNLVSSRLYREEWCAYLWYGEERKKPEWQHKYIADIQETLTNESLEIDCACELENRAKDIADYADGLDKKRPESLPSCMKS